MFSSKSVLSRGRGVYRVYSEAYKASRIRLYSDDTSSTSNTCSLYDARKISKELPKNDIDLPFEGLSDIPTGIFRQTCEEILGPYAGKCCYYRNPEYFSFHDMSFFDFTMYLNKYRIPQPNSERKPL